MNFKQWLERRAYMYDPENDDPAEAPDFNPWANEFDRAYYQSDITPLHPEIPDKKLSWEDRPKPDSNYPEPPEGTTMYSASPRGVSMYVPNSSPPPLPKSKPARPNRLPEPELKAPPKSRPARPNRLPLDSPRSPLDAPQWFGYPRPKNKLSD